MPGQVENALLHVLEADQSSHAELRVSAMHDRSPIHTFLFDSQGLLLTANKAALQFCQAGSGQLTGLPCLQCIIVSACPMQPHVFVLIGSFNPAFQLESHAWMSALHHIKMVRRYRIFGYDLSTSTLSDALIYRL